jgi:hypothetical protein
MTATIAADAAELLNNAASNAFALAIECSDSARAWAACGIKTEVRGLPS